MVLGLRSSDPDTEDFEYWEIPESIEYDHLMGFRADSVFYVQVFVSLEESKIKDVRCNCDDFTYPDEGESALDVDLACQHCISALVIVSHELNSNVIQSSSTEFLPLPECLDQILD